MRRAGRPFPKCFPAPTGLRRACGPRGGARDKVASAPCRRPPASLSSATGDPNPHSVLGSLRRLPSRGSSKCSEPGIADFSFPVSPADASVSPIKGKEVRKKLKSRQHLRLGRGKGVEGGGRCRAFAISDLLTSRKRMSPGAERGDLVKGRVF